MDANEVLVTIRQFVDTIWSFFNVILQAILTLLSGLTSLAGALG